MSALWIEQFFGSGSKTLKLNGQCIKSVKIMGITSISDSEYLFLQMYGKKY